MTRSELGSKLGDWFALFRALPRPIYVRGVVVQYKGAMLSVGHYMVLISMITQLQRKGNMRARHMYVMDGVKSCYEIGRALANKCSVASLDSRVLVFHTQTMQRVKPLPIIKSSQVKSQARGSSKVTCILERRDTQAKKKWVPRLCSLSEQGRQTSRSEAERR